MKELGLVIRMEAQEKEEGKATTAHREKSTILNHTILIKDTEVEEKLKGIDTHPLIKELKIPTN